MVRQFRKNCYQGAGATVAEAETSLTVTVRVTVPDFRKAVSLSVSGLNQASCQGLTPSNPPMWTLSDPIRSGLR
jgi:hypothetical protein